MTVHVGETSWVDKFLFVLLVLLCPVYVVTRRIFEHPHRVRLEESEKT